VFVGLAHNKPKNNSKQNFTNTLKLEIKHLEIEWNYKKKIKYFLKNLKIKVEKPFSSPIPTQSKSWRGLHM
jgi:hypothetical protein